MSLALSSTSLSFYKARQRHMYILQNTTPGLYIACALQLQVLLSDTDHIMLPALSSSAFPSLSEASQRQMPAGTSSSNGPEQQHPLRPYWEYLSFLFKRQPEPDPDQMLELSYRDYLQVISCSHAGTNDHSHTVINVLVYTVPCDHASTHDHSCSVCMPLFTPSRAIMHEQVVTAIHQFCIYYCASPCMGVSLSSA